MNQLFASVPQVPAKMPYLIRNFSLINVLQILLQIPGGLAIEWIRWVKEPKLNLTNEYCFQNII